MSGWDPERGFAGPLIEFLKDIDRRFVPEPAVMEAAQGWLCRELEKAQGPFPCRHFSSRSGFKLAPKVNFFSSVEHDLPFDVIASDNECSSSLYAALRAGVKLERMSMLEALQRGIIKTGILTREKSTDSSRRRFVEHGIRADMNRHPMRIALHNLTLCHLADAADRVSNLEWASREDELRARIFRSLSPLNVFPFPHPSSRAGGYIQRLGSGQDTDLGGTPEFQHFIANFLIRKFVGTLSSAVQVWFSHARYTPPIMTEAEFLSYGSQHLHLEPPTARVAKASAPVLASAPAPVPARVHSVTSARIEEVLQVREARLRELLVRVTRNPGDLLTSNADFETNSENYFFVIEKPGMNPARVRACLEEASNGVLELKDCSRSGRSDGKQYFTRIPGCYIVVRGPRTRTNRNNWYPY